jgi:hypothetical protein
VDDFLKKLDKMDKADMKRIGGYEKKANKALAKADKKMSAKPKKTSKIWS